jgi:hypothetical protein
MRRMGSIAHTSQQDRLWAVAPASLASGYGHEWWLQGPATTCRQTGRLSFTCDPGLKPVFSQGRVFSQRFPIASVPHDWKHIDVTQTRKKPVFKIAAKRPLSISETIGRAR